MKAKLLYFLVTPIIIFLSCGKSQNNIHFHGQILFVCNGQSVKNASCQISVVYDTGHQGANNVGSVITDNDGYYSLTADVSYQGTIQYYSLSVNAPGAIYGSGSYYGPFNDEILMNGRALKYERINFHIKNTNPFDNNDIFDSLIVICDSSLFLGNTYLVAANLYGQNIDTIISESIVDQPYFICKYSFKKNSITTLKYDTVNLGCDGNTSVDVFF